MRKGKDMKDTKSATDEVDDSANSLHPERAIQREDLRLDCLRLAAQRQGARDSRGLLEIAEEYFHWVTAESAADRVGDREVPIAPNAINWPAAKTAPLKHQARLSLGTKSGEVKTKSESSARRPRAAARD